jgi:hypothetical protein
MCVMGIIYFYQQVCSVGRMCKHLLSARRESKLTLFRRKFLACAFRTRDFNM